MRSSSLASREKGENATWRWLEPKPEAAAALKVLFVSHNHPDLFPGGAEIFAYNLFRELRERHPVTPFFLAASSRLSHEMHSGTAFQAMAGRPDEMLIWGDRFDYFTQSQRSLSLLHTDFAEFLSEFKPDVVHFHHILRIGVEAIKVVRRQLPSAKIVLTLHDYIPICHRDGQMVRKDTGALCSGASPAKCHQCFPDIPAARFKMREHFIRTHFDGVDAFIAPSQFLADRYREWGLPPERIHVLHNGQPGGAPAPLRKLGKEEKPNRFAFFGQITPYKGVDILMEAAGELVRSGFGNFSVDIFGTVALQQDAFKEQFQRRLESCQSHVTWHGGYDNSELPDLMAEFDWVVVPSIWWENSPLVIDEAFSHRRPVICSGIGGMAEKVKHGVNGLHFKAGSHMSLAQAIRYAAEDRKLWQGLSRRINPPHSMGECAQDHRKLYKQLLAYS